MWKTLVLIISSVATFQVFRHHQVMVKCLENKPNLLIVFGCWTKQETHQIYLNFYERNPQLRVAFLAAHRGSLGKIPTKKYDRVSYILDMDCQAAKSVLEDAAYQDYDSFHFSKFQFIYSWHLLSDKLNDDIDVLRLLEELKTRMDMNVRFYRSDFQYEIYNPGINVGVQIMHKPTLSYYDSRKNMTGVLIRSSNVINYPFTTSFHEYMMDLHLMKHDIFSKFHYQLFLVLVEVHGFSYNTTLPSSWYGNTSIGIDGGMAQQLWQDQIDLSSAGGLLALLGTDRMHYYDYLMPYFKFRAPFHFRNPGVVKPNFQEILKPFDRKSWWAAIYVTIVVCVGYEICSYFESGRMFESVFVAIAAYSQQGLTQVPSHMAGRIIFLQLFICSLLLYNYYASSLVSSLISTTPEVIKTIAELVRSDLKVFIELQPYTITYTVGKVKTDHEIYLLNKTKFYQNGYLNKLSAEEGIQKVHQGGVAYHLEQTTAYTLISETFEQDAICDLAEIPLIKSDTSLMAQKRSQYKKLIQITLRIMLERGIAKKLHNTWVKGKPECLSNARVISVTVNDLFLPYFLLAIGVLCSIVVFGMEIMWKRFKN